MTTTAQTQESKTRGGKPVVPAVADPKRSQKLALFIVCVVGVLGLAYATVRYNLARLSKQPDPNNLFTTLREGLGNTDFSVKGTPGLSQKTTR